MGRGGGGSGDWGAATDEGGAGEEVDEEAVGVEGRGGGGVAVLGEGEEDASTWSAVGKAVESASHVALGWCTR